MAYAMEVVEVEAQPALSVRTVTSAADLPEQLGKAFGSIVSYLVAKGENPIGPAFVAYYNMDMEKLDVEIGFPVAHPIAGAGEIETSQIPAGKKATCMYKGPYKDMAPTWEALTSWVSESGLTATGVAYEHYYNSPMEVPETELLTKIEFLLK